MRVGPVGITNGVFGRRPHCIYRGFCLQGCKVNAKASPFVTHLPDALEHGVEVRARCMATRVVMEDGTRRARGVAYMREGTGEEHMQRARVVAIAGYSIESPRLLLNSACRGFPHGLGNNEDQVGRYVMVQGATQSAGRFPDELRMYKAPPPEVSSEDFYETDSSRGFARGFSIQTVSPLPIGWAEHVLAEGHWGMALREYMRDYNHWATAGVLNELLPLADNRVTLADETDTYGLPIARFDYSLCDNDRANIAWSRTVLRELLLAAGAQDVLSIDRFAHLVGGCRMGTSAEDSVIDSEQRTWAVRNLFVTDGSVCPTQGAANPALTIMAMSSRVAELLAARGVDAAARRRGERTSVAVDVDIPGRHAERTRA
jgi:choline dehydrogenase-like flavoprotein